MSVPGSNLLKAAFSVIKTFPVQYFKFDSRAANDRGEYISQHVEFPVVRASLQAVPRDMYVELGLDLSRSYVTAYMCFQATPVDRELSGDEFITKQGVKYQVVSTTDWLWDGWCSVLAVEIKP